MSTAPGTLRRKEDIAAEAERHQRPEDDQHAGERGEAGGEGLGGKRLYPPPEEHDEGKDEHQHPGQGDPHVYLRSLDMVEEVGLRIVVGREDQLAHCARGGKVDDDVLPGLGHQGRDDRDEQLGLQNEDGGDGECREERPEGLLPDDQDEKDDRQEQAGGAHGKLHVGPQGELLHREGYSPGGEQILQVGAHLVDRVAVIRPRHGYFRQDVVKVHVVYLAQKMCGQRRNYFRRG